MANERIFLSPPHLGDEEQTLVQEAFDINFIAPVGPHLDRFEAEVCEYTGIKYAAALSSGTAAIHLALREAGIGPGDEVLASTLTFIGSVSSIVHQGATPVFVDCDERTWNMDPALVATALREAEQAGKLPKAILPTDIYGQAADLDALREVCAPYGIPIIVDSAEALGARYKDKHAGKGADAAVYSFNGNKIITTGGGGMLVSDNEELIQRARFLATQARSPAPWYEHDEVGYNYRLSNVAAAIGIGQMHVLDQRVNRKRAIFDHYQARLSEADGISFMPEYEGSRATRWLSVIQIDAGVFGADPETIRLRLEEENIESRPVWKPMHLQPVFASARCHGGAVAEKLFSRGLCLPSGTALNDRQIDDICDILLSCGGK